MCRVGLVNGEELTLFLHQLCVELVLLMVRDLLCFYTNYGTRLYHAIHETIVKV